jgi:hypothetical protein
MALAIILDENLQKAKTLKSVSYPIANVIPVTRGIKINEVLPFRVRFTTIGLAGANANVPGIGLQIIGINNYIL